MIPGQPDEIVSVVAKDNPMRKSTLIAAAACLAACLLFFAVPSYREAFRISLTQIHFLISEMDGYYNPSDRPEIAKRAEQKSIDARSRVFAKLADQARKNHDAEGLAFAAIRPFERGGREDLNSAALANEAVGLDPKLTWIYAMVAHGNRSLPEADEWIGKLQQFDPQNALPHLLIAERAAAGKYFGKEASIPAWQDAMAEAFASSKLDNYSDRLQELDHKVMLRYGVDDPHETMDEYFLTFIGVGVPQNAQSGDYAQLLVDSGDTLAARGDYRGAEKKYLLAVHFGELLQPRQERSPESLFFAMIANSVLRGPYHHLALLYEKQGNQEQAELFTYLAGKAEQDVRDEPALAAQLRGYEFQDAGRNANILSISGIAMFLCAGIVSFCAIVKIARSRSLRPSKLHPGRITTVLGCAGLIGLLLSSAALYLSYRPYAEMVRTYFRDGDTSHLGTVGMFFDTLEYSNFYTLPTYLVDFWIGVIALCAVALVFTTSKAISTYRHPALAS